MLLYRALLLLLSPLFALALLRQVLRGREKPRDLAERFTAGIPRHPQSCATRLWVHGASNGELTAARSLIEEALNRAPGLEILVTVNTVSARRMVRKWHLPRVQVRLAPMDLRPVLRHFLDLYDPAALISLENEIWPNRFTILKKRGIPVIVAGARMSERTARRWSQMQWLFGPTTRATIGAITRLAAQDAASEQRLLQLGLPTDRLLPRMNLKTTVDLQAAPEAALAALRPHFPHATTLLAASTHEGEERVLLEAYGLLRQSQPDARLILAPRHPRRGDAVAQELTRAGLAFARRSLNDDPAAAPVYLADTLGEMALWYQLAGLCFVGGSLGPRGGHTPFEPAQFDCALLYGPHVSNHLAAYQALADIGGAVEVTDAAGLAAAAARLMADPEAAAQMAQNAHTALTPLRAAQMRQEAFWNALADLPKLQALA
ncbi:3-deoxy-D-manno-octulosonic acid transferase [Celeribacter ethanolicus]|uniref:3-deoxy-D-manno-octulosonic acid transferase n=1 Tax=Celeribacter ethanolicus TaxID=1758178 RepID=UPI0008313B0F|nr:glycosyltransferase N-terminal domain-containing protein [Celeribacter ethanolicus]